MQAFSRGLIVQGVLPRKYKTMIILTGAYYGVASEVACCASLVATGS